MKQGATDVGAGRYTLAPAAELAFLAHGRGAGVWHTFNAVADRAVGAAGGYTVIRLTLSVPTALALRTLGAIGAWVDTAALLFITDLTRRTLVTGIQAQFDLFFADFSRRYTFVVRTGGSTIAFVTVLAVWAELLTHGFLVD